jgi:hypothetical protein
VAAAPKTVKAAPPKSALQKRKEKSYRGCYQLPDTDFERLERLSQQCGITKASTLRNALAIMEKVLAATQVLIDGQPIMLIFANDPPRAAR